MNSVIFSSDDVPTETLFTRHYSPGLPVFCPDEKERKGQREGERENERDGGRASTSIATGIERSSLDVNSSILDTTIDLDETCTYPSDLALTAASCCHFSNRRVPFALAFSSNRAISRLERRVFQRYVACPGGQFRRDVSAAQLWRFARKCNKFYFHCHAAGTTDISKVEIASKRMTDSSLSLFSRVPPVPLRCFFFFFFCFPVGRYISNIVLSLIDTSIVERTSCGSSGRRIMNCARPRCVCRWYYVNKSIRKIRLFLIRQNRSRIALVDRPGSPVIESSFRRPSYN